MPQPIIPWEPSVFPSEIVAELNRRKVNKSFSYVKNDHNVWSADGDWKNYRGPMSPWVRFCSNGVGREKDKSGNKLQNIKEGFVFSGGKGFYDAYGFNKKNSMGSSDSIIGYLPNGVDVHTIANNIKESDYQIHVPPPEIERISVSIQKELYRRATVEWVCFSKAQLEYMAPYFLVPGISCVLEWGWNHFDPQCLVDLTNIDKLKDYSINPYPLYTNHILKSKGNYDVLMGIVTHFEWSVDGNKFRCKTEITSADRIYAGLLTEASVAAKQTDVDGELSPSPFNTLANFLEWSINAFKSINIASDVTRIPRLNNIVNYINEKHPNNWKEYVYGVFQGRKKAEDLKDKNSSSDFDVKSKNAEVWINLGLAFEIINYFVKELKLFKDQEAFRVDIDDVIITAHPNLISSNGSILLIPNANAPKYFCGNYGRMKTPTEHESAAKLKDLDELKNASSKTPAPTDQKSDYSNYRLSKICKQNGAVYRDNIDELINDLRYRFASSSRNFSFPVMSPISIDGVSRQYPAQFSGRLKDLYINVNYLAELSRKSEIRTYTELVEQMISDISDAAGGFWDFRLVSATGNGLNSESTMKVVDYKFVNTINNGDVYTFNCFDTDSLLLGIDFKPTLSNAQAIRTIYANVNQTDANVSVTNGDNELLDYKFRDRLRKDTVDKTSEPKGIPDNDFFEVMHSLQQYDPPENSYAMTMKDKRGQILQRRLALPSNEILNLLLDDGDQEHNPKYTGIMPGIQASFTIQGIGGLRTFMMFLVKNLPEPYSSENIIFRIVDVKESIESGKWVTTITAGVIPLRGYIKDRLGLVKK